MRVGRICPKRGISESADSLKGTYGACHATRWPRRHHDLFEPAFSRAKCELSRPGSLALLHLSETCYCSAGGNIVPRTWRKATRTDCKLTISFLLAPFDRPTHPFPLPPDLSRSHRLSAPALPRLSASLPAAVAPRRRLRQRSRSKSTLPSRQRSPALKPCRSPTSSWWIYPECLCE